MGRPSRLSTIISSSSASVSVARPGVEASSRRASAAFAIAVQAVQLRKDSHGPGHGRDRVLRHPEDQRALMLARIACTGALHRGHRPSSLSQCAERAPFDRGTEDGRKRRGGADLVLRVRAVAARELLVCQDARPGDGALEPLRQQRRGHRTSHVGLRDDSGEGFEGGHPLREQDFHPGNGGNRPVRRRVERVGRHGGVEGVETGRELQVVGKGVPGSRLGAGSRRTFCRRRHEHGAGCSGGQCAQGHGVSHLREDGPRTMWLCLKSAAREPGTTARDWRGTRR